MATKKLIMTVSLLSALVLTSCSEGTESRPGNAGRQSAPTGTPEDRMAWFKEAKFGMFVHWGPYSNLAGEWNGRQVPVGEIAEWIMQKLQIPAVQYREMARQFNPVKFDAAEWVNLASQAGMKYLVITAKHHDGFAMYPSKVSDYNIVDWTDFDRDPLRELSEECRKAGIRFSVYYSHREDWNEPYAYGNTWDFDFDPENNLELFEQNYLYTKAEAQVRELLEEYGPLGLIWFDRGLYTPDQARHFVELVRGIQPTCLVNGRVGNYEQDLMGDYQNLSDNGMPSGGVEEYWETPQTLNETWGYSRFDVRWKTPETVIRRLAEVVSKGGNYLLNVGPTGEGVIPQPSVDVLKAVGEWVKVNGESIYGTQASPFFELEWGRCTVKGQRLYLHVFEWPEDGVVQIPNLRSPVKRAYLLVDPETSFPAEQTDQGWQVTVGGSHPDKINTVVVVEFQGELKVDPPVTRQAGDGSLDLDCLKAETEGRAVKRFNRKGGFHISKWTGPEDAIQWDCQVDSPGEFEVQIIYSAPEGSIGREFVLDAGRGQVRGKVMQTGGWYEFKTLSLGKIRIGNPGHSKVRIKPAEAADTDLMYFKSIRLTR